MNALDLQALSAGAATTSLGKDSGEYRSLVANIVFDTKGKVRSNIVGYSDRACQTEVARISWEGEYKLGQTIRLELFPPYFQRGLDIDITKIKLLSSISGQDTQEFARDRFLTVGFNEKVRVQTADLSSYSRFALNELVGVSLLPPNVLNLTQEVSIFEIGFSVNSRGDERENNFSSADRFLGANLYSTEFSTFKK